MNITVKEIGLIKRMLESYEKEIKQAEIKESIKNEELEELEALKAKIENNINNRKGIRGM